MLALSAAQRTVVRARALAHAAQTLLAARSGAAAAPAPAAAYPLQSWKIGAPLSQPRRWYTAQRRWDTIAALSSGAGRAGIAVIRMSGPRAGALCKV